MKQQTSSPTSDGSSMMSHRDAEKYSKGFILKSIQVIVESRLGEKISRKCCPNRNDWFNITIQDDKDVEDRCLKALNSLKWIGEESKISSGFTIDSKWKICCEISLKTSDDHSMVLEYWLFENTPLGLENGANGSPLLNSNPYSFVNVHNKMGTLIKSLMSLSRATPAFKLSSRRADDSHPSHVICYRVFQCDLRTDQFFKQIDPESTDHQHFGPEIRLGSVRSAHNVLLVTFCYRTELTRCNTVKDSIDYVFNLPCKEDHFGGTRTKNDSNNKNVDKDGHTRRVSSKQLLGAFDSPSADSPPPFPLLPETSLLNLIEPNQLAYNAVTDITSSILDVAKVQLDNPASEPIKIPIERKVDRTPSPTSSLDSFVFVENRPLFAAEEENDVESFFNGPSPSFTNSGDVLEEINEISNQLAAIESNAHQWDSFVDSVCSPDAEEDDEEEAKTMT